MNIINGKVLAKTIKDEIKQKVAKMDEKPALAAILVGQDAASHLYVKLKEKACKYTGITFHKYLIDEDCPKQEILNVIEFLNTDRETDGILVQLPLPIKEWEDEIISAIDPKKDVDGFHQDTIKALLDGKPTIIPGLAQGIIELIESTKEPLEHKKCSIVCNNKIFSQPIEYLLKNKIQKINTYSPTTSNLDKLLLKSDIIIVAVGKPNFITKNMIKPGCIIIDVGINKDGNKVQGDVDFDNIDELEGYITPVPGGVGPMTVAMLLRNVMEMHKLFNL